MDPSQSADRVDSEIDRVFAQFQGLLTIAEAFVNRRRYLQATVCAQIAALYASYNHPGVFVSPRLDRVLRRIAEGTTTELPRRAAERPETAAIDRVLHVLTGAKPVGGDSRFVWRWIERDRTRRHSVALTTQLDFEVPGPLARAVAGSGGRIHVLDRNGEDVIRRGQALRDSARSADVVFLHVYPEDVVPALAFADTAGLPPVAMVAQADHQFWTGVSVCDAFVHLRESASQLSTERRGVDPAALAPSLGIPLEPTLAGPSRTEAKRSIDIPLDAVVLLSIARAIKYQPIAGQVSFLDALLPILDRHPNTFLLVVGPADDGDWRVMRERTQGRIRALGQLSDTAMFYQAADIYLDSFPFSSNTSLLEAGSTGLPLVGYFPYSTTSAVLGPGSPGLDDTIMCAGTVDEYRAILSRLIQDGSYRRTIGERTRKEIASRHVGEQWNEALEAMYRAVAVRRAGRGVDHPETPRATELDRLLNRYYSRHVPLGWVIGWYARHLTYVARVQVLQRMLRFNRSFPFSMFLPDWMRTSIGGRVRGWRRLPLIARWLSAKG